MEIFAGRTISIPGNRIMNYRDLIKTTKYSMFPYPIKTTSIPTTKSQIGADENIESTFPNELVPSDYILYFLIL